MSFRLRNVDSIRRGIKAIEEKEFKDIILLPDDSDSNSGESFVSLSDVQYDPKTLTEISDVLDGDGQLVFDINYSVDVESALKSNIQKVKFEIHSRDPRPLVSPTIGLRPGTRAYINRQLVNTLGSRGRRSAGTPTGKAATISRARPTIKTSKADKSNLRESNTGLITEFTVNTGINNSNRQLFLNAVRDAALRSRLGIIGTQNISTAQAASLAVDSLSQDYSALIAPPVTINTTVPGLQENAVRGLSGPRSNLIDRRVSEGVGAKFQESSQLLGSQAILSGRDPAAHLDMFYGSGPTSTSGSPKEPIRYDGATTIRNDVIVSTVGLTSDNRFLSVRPSGTQAQTTQRPASFKGSTAQEALYRKSASASLATVRGSQIPNIPLRQLTFKSTIRQFKAMFSVPLLSMMPKVNQYLWITVKLLGSDDKTYRTKTYKIDVRKQLKGYLTPVLAPSLRVVSQEEGKIELELEQRDPTATDLSVFRMVTRPEDLAESTWTRVTDIRANTRKGAVKFIDSTVSANASPNVVLYEVRCSGPFGSICPTTTRIVQKGVKKLASTARSNRLGTCNIVATQVANRIEIRVSRIPAGATRVFLKRQTVNSSLRERDIRRQIEIKAQGLDRTYHEIEDPNGTYTFEDTAVINRQIYRYVALFDWIDKERTNSTTEEFIEYRQVPDRPIISYLDNVVAGIDELGRSYVTFDLGATFADAGLEELNRILGDTGVSSLFVDELKKDRSLISNLLIYQVTRRNTRTGESVVWPLIQEGTFIDNEDSRASARGTSGPGVNATLRAGAQYLYTARLNIVNPERFFKQALTRIPASTRQIITDTDPNFVKVSAAKFAENFAVQPGTVLSPTTVERETKFSEEVQGAYTGISYTQVIDIPLYRAKPKNVTVNRSSIGKPANLIRWKVEGSIESVYCFQIDVTLNRENTFPLRSISPVISEDDQYEIRDELFTHEIAPVSYSVSVIYTDMSRSDVVKSNEVYSATTIPIRVLDAAIKKQLAIRPGLDLSRVNPGSLEERQLLASVNPLTGGPLSNPDISGQNLVDQVNAGRSVSTNFDTQSALKINNTLRRLR